jgi:hypothetical protein
MSLWLGFLVVLLVSSCTTAAVAQTNVWETYFNARYGYSLCYPADLFHPGPEPDAHDGVTFHGPPSTTLIAEGSYNAVSDTPASAAANELSAVAGGPVQITYRAAKNNWAVASGIAGDKIVFVRQVLYRDVMAGFEIAYPVSEKARYDPIVTRLSSCLKEAHQVAGGASGAGASNLYCGIARDYGDAYQIMDGKFNPRWDRSDLAPPKDLKGLGSSHLLREGRCLCVEGLVKAYQRAGERAYEFTEIRGLRPC